MSPLLITRFGAVSLTTTSSEIETTLITRVSCVRACAAGGSDEAREQHEGGETAQHPPSVPQFAGPGLIQGEQPGQERQHGSIERVRPLEVRQVVRSPRS